MKDKTKVKEVNTAIDDSEQTTQSQKTGKTEAQEPRCVGALCAAHGEELEEMRKIASKIGANKIVISGAGYEATLTPNKQQETKNG